MVRFIVECGYTEDEYIGFDVKILSDVKALSNVNSKRTK